MNCDSCGSMQRPWRWGSYGHWLSLLLLAALVAAVACGGTTSTGDDLDNERVAKDLVARLAVELRAYRDMGLEPDLVRARSTCSELGAEDMKGRLLGTTYGATLTSACDVVEVLGIGPEAHVETAISLVDLALESLE